ncbi:MAG: DUF2842 domain-containing protein [Alteripontixanthobacter sp.]
MREEPTWRIPVGILALVIGLTAYALFFVGISDWITRQHVALQTIIYIVLGTAWLLPLRRFLIWMETGKWSAPDKAE